MTENPYFSDVYTLLEHFAGQRKKAVIDYFNEYRELKTVAGLIKTVDKEKGHLEMVTGEQIPAEQVVSLNGQVMPGYEDYQQALGARCSVVNPGK